MLLCRKKRCRNLIKNRIFFYNHIVGKKTESRAVPIFGLRSNFDLEKNLKVVFFCEQFVFGHRNHDCTWRYICLIVRIQWFRTSLCFSPKLPHEIFVIRDPFTCNLLAIHLQWIADRSQKDRYWMGSELQMDGSGLQKFRDGNSGEEHIEVLNH